MSERTRLEQAAKDPWYTDDIQRHMYDRLDDVVQSSSLVECVNSIVRPYLNTTRNQITQELLNLIMFYHNHRRYRAGKRSKHTPMELFTGQPQTADWLELLCEEIDQKQPGGGQRGHDLLQTCPVDPLQVALDAHRPDRPTLRVDRLQPEPAEAGNQRRQQQADHQLTTCAVPGPGGVPRLSPCQPPRAAW